STRPAGGRVRRRRHAARGTGPQRLSAAADHPAEAYDRLNKPTIELQITFIISAKPEIGLAADAGAGGGMIEGDGTGCDGKAAAAAGLSCASFSFRHLANWFISCVAVAWMMPTPRPYCATAPDSVRLVWTSTLEPAPAGSRRNTEEALAPPRPLASVPCAETRAVRLASSIWSNLTSPAKVNATGPSRTPILPL